jgi:hypothetical protein
VPLVSTRSTPANAIMSCGGWMEPAASERSLVVHFARTLPQLRSPARRRMLVSAAHCWGPRAADTRQRTFGLHAGLGSQLDAFLIVRVLQGYQETLHAVNVDSPGKGLSTPRSTMFPRQSKRGRVQDDTRARSGRRGLWCRPLPRVEAREAALQRRPHVALDEKNSRPKAKPRKIRSGASLPEIARTDD